MNADMMITPYLRLTAEQMYEALLLSAVSQPMLFSNGMIGKIQQDRYQVLH